MLDRRRLADESAPAVQPVRTAHRKLASRQTQFSVVSAVLPFTLAVVLLVDYFVGHAHIDRGTLLLWVGSYLLLTILPLGCGQRYPRWAGLLLIAFLTFWSTYLLLNSLHPHMELNAMMAAPAAALYLGWFYRPWIARSMLGLHLLIMAEIVLLGPADWAQEFSAPLTLLYTVLISWFCLETGNYLRQRAEDEARRDPLTGALNRYGLAELGGRVLAQARRSGDPVTIAAIDFDDFKAINDAGGHAAGDAALCESAALWMGGLGPGDLVVRTGGDEFVLLIHADEERAAERLAALRKQATFPWSWGLTRFRSGDALDDLMRRADEQLYRAKEVRGGSAASS